MIIDLRSDTVTLPSAEMKNAMVNARLGDDVFMEDPTVNELENFAAKMFGKEAGLFCPSGTMTNQIAIKCHTQPGDEVICDENSHIYNYEGGGISFNSGVQAKLIKGSRGRINANQIIENINPEYDWLTKTSLVCLENTVNKAGGSYYKIQDIKPITEVCQHHKLALHLDGARIFNALVETNERASDIGQLFDSVSICLSKGLGAPVGSVLLGSNDFIKKARKLRKVFGGGMRQAGFLAAAGIYSLQNNITRLKDDHLRARTIEKALRELSVVKSTLPVDTNIVIFDLTDAITGTEFQQKLGKLNIKVSLFGKQTVRIVTHMDFTDDMLNEFIKALKTI